MFIQKLKYIKCKNTHYFSDVDLSTFADDIELERHAEVRSLKFDEVPRTTDGMFNILKTMWEEMLDQGVSIKSFFLDDSPN